MNTNVPPTARKHIVKRYTSADADKLFVESQKSLTMKLRETQAWKNYNAARRNKFMRKRIRQAAANTCELCGHPLDLKFDAHHCDYNHLCTMEGTIVSQEDENTVLPDCERCHDTRRQTFNGCRHRFAALHPHCHWVLHELIRLAEYEDENLATRQRQHQLSTTPNAARKRKKRDRK